jgi:two-component system nitrogen regulation response regulator GlnG
MRPTSSRGAFMPVPSSVFTILLLSADADLQAQVKQVFKDASVTIARDGAAFQKDSQRHQFDTVVVESRGGHEKTITLPNEIDLSRTLVITGSRAVLRRTAKMMQLNSQPSGQPHQGKTRDASLEGYLEMKMGDFVKGMRNGSAKNLHPILISAVERPLIASVLRETDGNQIQAAELLGLNRNTLRKKIVDLRIPLKKAKGHSSRTA